MLKLFVPLVSMLYFCTLFSSSHCHAEDDFESEVKAVAESMVEFLKSENFKKIAIRKFEGPSAFPASAGPGIAELLVTHFRTEGFEVVGLSAKADVAVTGKYKLYPTAGGPTRPKLVELVVAFTLEDEFGNPFEKFGSQGRMELKSKDTQAIAEKIGLPVKFDTTSGSKSLRKEKDHAALLDAYRHPKAEIQNGNEVRRSDSPYGMQILIGEKAMPILDQDGFAFCKLTRGDEFAILLRNDSEYDAAVELKLDGISTFHFSALRSATDASKPLYMHYIVPRKSKSLVIGWHIDNDRVKKYKITGHDESAAMAANQEVEVGTISGAFSAAWEEGEEIPKGEPDIERGLGEREDFVGLGDEKQFSVKAVRREIGQVREVLTIRYRK